MVNWGIIGAGRIARQFANDVNKTKHAKLCAVASRELSRAKEFAKRFDIADAYGDYESLLNDSSIQAIYIATPHTSHYEQSAAALRAGKAVLCEKPICIDAEQCRSLMQIAESEKVYLMEGMWTYFLPAVQKAKSWVSEGRIGTIKSMVADFGFPMPYDPNTRVYNKDLAGGCLLDMGIYPIAIAQLFLGPQPDKISVEAQFADNGVEDDLKMMFSYGNVSAELNTSFRHKLPNFCRIIGDQGQIEIPNFWCSNQCSLFEGSNLVDQFDDQRQGMGFEFEIEAVCLDLLEGRLQSETHPLEQSLDFLKQMDRVKSLF